MYCGSNKTALCSQRQIAKAMMSLLEEKSFDQISVCELCRLAGISRQTFYSLFSSQENVIVFLLKEKYCFETGDCCESGSSADCVSSRAAGSGEPCGSPAPQAEPSAAESSSCSPSAPSPENQPLTARILSHICAGYILQNRDFIRLLTVNHIDHLLDDSFFEALEECPGFLSGESDCTRRYAAGFYAGGISSVARCYAHEGCSCCRKELEEMLFTFFTGALF